MSTARARPRPALLAALGAALLTLAGCRTTAQVWVTTGDRAKLLHRDARDGSPIVLKPFTIETLTEAVRAALDRPAR